VFLCNLSVYSWVITKRDYKPSRVTADCPLLFDGRRQLQRFVNLVGTNFQGRNLL